MGAVRSAEPWTSSMAMAVAVALLLLAGAAPPADVKSDDLYSRRGVGIHQLAEVPWLSALQAPGVTAELAALAADDGRSRQQSGGGAFSPNYDPTHIAVTDEGWEALALMNKGELLKTGCTLAPITCTALEAMHPHLAPRPAATEVGVRSNSTSNHPFLWDKWL